jgi:hypothetical protein
MRNRMACLAVIASFGAAGCSSEAGGILPPDEHGAGLAIKIVSIVRDSTGYAVQFQMTNQDKAILSLNVACDWRVDVLADNVWTVLGQNGSCQPVAYGLSPGQSMPSSVHVRTAQALALGTLLRLAIGWDINQESLSDPMSVN